MIETSELDYFLGMMELDKDDIEEMGYTGYESEYVASVLDNHFGIFFEDGGKQLKGLTELIQNKFSLVTSAVNIEKLRRAS